MQFNKQDLHSNGLKILKQKIVSFQNYFSVYIFYNASKGKNVNNSMTHTLFYHLKSYIRLTQSNYNIRHYIVLFSVLSPNQACRLRLGIRTDLAISLSRSSRGGLLGGGCQSTWNFRRLKAKMQGREKKNQGCQKCIWKHFIDKIFLL